MRSFYPKRRRLRIQKLTLFFSKPPSLRIMASLRIPTFEALFVKQKKDTCSYVLSFVFEGFEGIRVIIFSFVCEAFSVPSFPSLKIPTRDTSFKIKYFNKQIEDLKRIGFCFMCLIFDFDKKASKGKQKYAQQGIQAAHRILVLKNKRYEKQNKKILKA